MNDNRTIRIMVFEPGRAPYTTMLEDSLEHRQELVGGDIECIPLPCETVLCCNASGKLTGLPENRQYGPDTLHGTFFLYGDTPEGRGVSLTDEQIAMYQEYFPQPVPAAVSFEVRSAADMKEFIIYDCGVMQTPTSIFRDADHRLLCGSVLPYEIPVFHKALSECGSLEVRPVAICVPQEIQEYCMELFGEDVQIAAASHDLFAKRANGQIYRPLVEKYIAGEKRL